MVFCNIESAEFVTIFFKVTILILIDGFLQFTIVNDDNPFCETRSHNPYFNRWFSAICSIELLKSDNESHNPYFNRWFSAMKKLS